jgi:multiple sugar transport system permease protein
MKQITLDQTQGIPARKVRVINKMKRQEMRVAYLFVLPFLVSLTIFWVIPVFNTFYMSVMDYNSLRPLSDLGYIGVQNYIDVFTDSDNMSSFGRSLAFAAIEVPLMLVVALMIALVMNGKYFGRGALRTMILIPYVCNITAVTIAWRSLLDPSSGPINVILSSLGWTDLPRWFSDPNMALGLAAVVYVYMNVSYQALVFLAALQEVSPELYESARIDGASGWRQFWSVTLPSISPTTFFLMVTSILGSFQTYNLIATLTNGGPGGTTEVAAFRIVKLAFGYNQFSVATAQSVVLFLMLMVLTVIQFKGQKKWVNY